MPKWHLMTATSSTSVLALLNYSKSLQRSTLTLRVTRLIGSKETVIRGSKDRVVIPVGALNKEVATREGATSPEAGEDVVAVVAAAVDL